MGSFLNGYRTGYLCRLCCRMDSKVIHLYGVIALQIRLLEKIREFLPLRIMPNDQLPKTICWRCVKLLDDQNKLIAKIRYSSQLIKCRQKHRELLYRYNDKKLIALKRRNLRARRKLLLAKKVKLKDESVSEKKLSQTHNKDIVVKLRKKLKELVKIDPVAFSSNRIKKLINPKIERSVKIDVEVSRKRKLIQQQSKTKQIKKRKLNEKNKKTKKSDKNKKIKESEKNKKTKESGKNKKIKKSGQNKKTKENEKNKKTKKNRQNLKRTAKKDKTKKKVLMAKRKKRTLPKYKSFLKNRLNYLKRIQIRKIIAKDGKLRTIYNDFLQNIYPSSFVIGQKHPSLDVKLNKLKRKIYFMHKNRRRIWRLQILADSDRLQESDKEKILLQMKIFKISHRLQAEHLREELFKTITKFNFDQYFSKQFPNCPPGSTPARPRKRRNTMSLIEARQLLLTDPSLAIEEDTEDNSLIDTSSSTIVENEESDRSRNSTDGISDSNDGLSDSSDESSDSNDRDSDLIDERSDNNDGDNGAGRSDSNDEDEDRKFLIVETDSSYPVEEASSCFLHDDTILEEIDDIVIHVKKKSSIKPLFLKVYCHDSPRSSSNNDASDDESSNDSS